MDIRRMRTYIDTLISGHLYYTLGLRGLVLEFFLNSILLHMVSFQYIDPGSGSAIMSAIIGFFVVIGLTIKSFWYKIKSIFVKTPDDGAE